MKLNKRALENFTEKKVLEGLHHQEIYDEVVLNSNYKIQEIASVIRKIPELRKRKDSNPSNFVLMGIMGLTMIAYIMDAGLTDNNEGVIFLRFIGLVIPVFLFYGLYKFKRNAHLIAGVVFSTMAFIELIKTFYFNDMFLLAIVFTDAFAAILAFYLNRKLCSDYIFNKEFSGDSPDERKKAITFTD